MRKAVAYARYSSDNQRDESIDAQVRAIKAYAKNNNIIIVHTFIDRAKSATSDNRPDFQRMIKSSDNRNFELVIVHKLDRFSRDKYDSAYYKRRLKKNGVRVVSVLEHIDDSPEGALMETLIEGMAQFYSANLGREVMKGLKENAYGCKYTGGHVPLGYKINQTTKLYEIDEEEAKIIRIIFKMYLDGYGYNKITSYLKEHNYHTKEGKDFGNNSLHDILRNEKYAGTYVFNLHTSKDAEGKRNNHSYKSDKDVIRKEGGIPAIITKEDFEKVKKKMQANKKRAGTYKAKELFLLSGLIYCGECGCAMVGNTKYCGRNKLKYVTYRCNKKDRTKSCHNKEIRREYIENYVLYELQNEIFNDRNIPRLVEMLNEYQNSKRNSQGSEIAELKKELNQTNTHISNLSNAIKTQARDTGTISSLLTEDLETLNNKKEVLEIELNKNIAMQENHVLDEKVMRKILVEFKTYIQDKNIPEIKKFIGQYVKKVIIFEDYIKVVFKLNTIVFLDGGGERAKSEHVYLIEGMLVLLLNFQKI